MKKTGYNITGNGEFMDCPSVNLYIKKKDGI